MSDADVLTHFAKRTFRETYEPLNRPEDFKQYMADNFSVEQQTKKLSDPGVNTFLCEIEDNLAGYGELWSSPPPDCIVAEKLLEIRRLYVDKPWQGKSVASRLMQAMLDDARSRQVNGVWLGVWEHSPRAQAFYKKSGFVKVGQHVFRLGSAMQTDYILYCRFPQA